MTFLVTGGTGFIGSHVIEGIVRHGGRAICLDRAPDPEVVARFPSGVTVIECDLSQRDQLGAFFRGQSEIERVIHLAYLMGAESEADPPAAMRVNALGTANLLAEACARGAKRIVLASSESVYGGRPSIYGDRPVKEEDFCAPQDHVLNYSLTKLLNEHLAGKYEAQYGIPIVSLRLAIVYGPGRKRGTTAWASDFASLPALGKPVTLPFPEDDLNCYIYVADAAEQIYQLATKPTLRHRTYNSGGHTVRARDLAAMVREWIPKAQITFSPRGSPSPFIHRMDDRRIREELGFPLRSMREGIQDHIARAREQGLGGLGAEQHALQRG